MSTIKFLSLYRHQLVKHCHAVCQVCSTSLSLAWSTPYTTKVWEKGSGDQPILKQKAMMAVLIGCKQTTLHK